MCKLFIYDVNIMLGKNHHEENKVQVSLLIIFMGFSKKLKNEINKKEVFLNVNEIKCEKACINK